MNNNDIDILVSELDYQCYKYNRTISPDVSPDRWRAIFGNRVDNLEKRYQDEISQTVSV